MHVSSYNNAIEYDIKIAYCIKFRKGERIKHKEPIDTRAI